MSNYLYHGPARPCPLCGGVTDCRTNQLTGGVGCRRTSDIMPPAGWRFAKIDAHGFSVFYADEFDDRQPITDFAKKKIDAARKAKAAGPVITGGTTAFDRIAEDARPMTADECQQLAKRLTLPTGIFALLDVMRLDCDDRNKPAWVFPERDAAGVIVGYTLRYADGSKKNHGHRGLSIPAAWAADATATIYLCEGATDTLALHALGLTAIGRPSNLGGTDQLSGLLSSVGRERRIVVVGENDRKADGSWPGRGGAEKTAAALAEALGRPVAVAFPPAGIKDARDLIVQHADAVRAKQTTLRVLGEEFEAHAAATEVVYSPADTRDAEASRSDVPAEVVAAPWESGVIDPPRLGFTAADCVPADDVIPPPPEDAVCPRRQPIYQEREGGGECRIVLPDCACWDCVVCGPRKKQQHVDTVRDHVGAYGGKVYRFTCTADDWRKVSRSMGQRRGKDKEITRYAIDYIAPVRRDGSLTVYAVEAPTSPALKPEDVTELDNDEAIRQLTREIELLPCPRKGQRLVKHSRGWKLTPDREPGERNTGWKTNRAAARLCTEECAREILAGHQVSMEERVQRYRYFSTAFLTWKNKDWGVRDKIVADLGAGWFGASEIDVESAFFDGPATGAGEGMEQYFDWTCAP